MALRNDVRQACITIQTLTDAVIENTERVNIIIDTNSGLTRGNVVVQQFNATLLISKYPYADPLVVYLVCTIME